MSVQSRPTTTQRTAPRIGFVRPGQVEGAFRVLLYLALMILVLLSILGTFYGRQGKAAPITTPVATVSRMAADIRAAPESLGTAFAIQLVLTLLQYGARQFARRDRRWWILYLVVLSISVYYNWQAYWTPLQAFIPGYLAAVLIIAGDVLPEFIAIRHE